MAKSFYYDSISLNSASTAGDRYINSSRAWYGEVNPPSSSNESRLNDMSIGSGASYTAGADESGIYKAGIRLDSGSDQNVDFVAFYLSSTLSGLTVKLYGSDDASSSYTELASKADPGTGWHVVTFSQVSKRYFVLQIEDTSTFSSKEIAEVIIGTKYDFDVNFDLNNKIGEEFGTDVMTSYGGQEYANKRHEPKTTWNWNWSYLSSSQKTSLDSLNSSVQDYKKFIYDDEANYHYVRMVKPLDFTEVAPSVYSTSMTLREQLA